MIVVKERTAKQARPLDLALRDKKEEGNIRRTGRGNGSKRNDKKRSPEE